MLTMLPLVLFSAVSCARLPGTGRQEEDGPVSAQGKAFDHAHGAWTRILAKHVRGDRFEYATLSRDRTELTAYLQALEMVEESDFQKWSAEERFAFWINAYNAHTVSLVVENYPLESIKDLGSILKPVWKKEFVPLAPLVGRASNDRLSLDEIEHGILREQFKDARIHAAVNCASEGCPPLRGEAFVADRLGEQLDQQVRSWLADSGRNRFEKEKKTVHASKVFDWFEADFVREAGSVLKWIARYAPPEHATWVAEPHARLAFLDYSWKLNDLR